MTAVELTLDICASRSAPGVAPVPLPPPPTTPPAPGTTATDKWFGGRFLGVQDAGKNQERALLIVGAVKPSFGLLGSFANSLVLRQVVISGNNVTSLDTKVQVFTDEDPKSSGAARGNFIDNIPVNGTQFWVEASTLSTARRDTGFQLGLKGVDDDGDRVAISAVQIEVTDTATTTAPGVTFVRFGLWDNAFRADGTVFNDPAEADNFAGADSLRFHIRIKDPGVQSSRSVHVNWRTLKQDDTNLDAPPNTSVALNQCITLVATPASSGTFISRGLMLVTDKDDQNQPTHSGMPAGLLDVNAIRNINQSNHRIRRGSMLGKIAVQYPVFIPTTPTALPVTPPGAATLKLPIFKRNPEDRRKLPLQIFVLRVAAGGAGVIPTAVGSTVWNTDLRVIRETYERIGITVETVVDPSTPATDIVTNGGDSLVLIDPPTGVNSANVTFADETAIGTAHPALADTIRVFFVGGLGSGNGGETWEDAIVSATDSRRGTVFTIQSTGSYAAAHEVGHALSNKRAAVPTDGHYKAPTIPANNRLRNNQNLMKREFLGAEGVSGSKRLWDAADGDAFNQYTAIRGSHYTRNL